MARLALEQSPASSLPRRFLLSAPLWGMFAGLLLIADGDLLLRSRWLPATLALVHAFTLGVLGNAMFGSTLQFLPTAAGVRVRGTARFGPWLHASFNLGAILLVAGWLAGWRAGVLAGGIVLPLAFMLLAAMTLPGLVMAGGQRLLHAGFVTALGSALLAALFGGCLALGAGGWLGMALPALTDVHASWGILGWVMVLMASVGRVVMPMFQGTRTVPAVAQAIWLGSLPLALGAGAWQRLGYDDASVLRLVLAIYALSFAGAGLWLQRQAPRPRRGPLRLSWMVGWTLLALAAATLLAGTRGGRLAAVLGLGIALPLMVNGMLLEIVGFLGWIGLHRHIGRGVQLPGVQRLLPATDKIRVLLAQLLLALLLPAAVLWPSPWLARSAGLAMLLAWLGVWLACLGVSRRTKRFRLTMESRP